MRAFLVGSGAPCGSRCSRRTAGDRGTRSRARRARRFARSPFEGGTVEGELVAWTDAELRAPVRAVEDRLRRPQLRRAREGARQRRPRRAAAVPQAAVGDHRTGRDRRAPRREREGRARGRARRRHRQARVARVSRGRALVRPRLHVRERRHRPRPPEEGRSVVAREGLRHVLPRRPVDRDGPRPERSLREVHRRRRRSGRTAARRR